MNDTSDKVRRMLRRRYAELTGIERLLMGADMFETARSFALASFPPGLPPREVRRRLCARLYGPLAERAYGRPEGITGGTAGRD